MLAGNRVAGAMPNRCHYGPLPSCGFQSYRKTQGSVLVSRSKSDPRGFPGARHSIGLRSAPRLIQQFAHGMIRSIENTCVPGDLYCGRNQQFLASLDLVWIFQLIGIRVEDPHVGIGIAIETLGDLGERVARLNRVLLCGGRLGGRRQTSVDGNVTGDVSKPTALR